MKYYIESETLTVKINVIEVLPQALVVVSFMKKEEVIAQVRYQRRIGTATMFKYHQIGFFTKVVGPDILLTIVIQPLDK